MKIFFPNNHNSLDEQLASESLTEELSKAVIQNEVGAM
jgi:hypothetical protein